MEIDISNLILSYASENNCIAGICGAEALSREPQYHNLKTPFVSRDIEKRTDPSKHLTDARSMIVYGRGYEPSRYENLSCLGTALDYHTELKRILNGLADEIKKALCGQAFNYCIKIDSGTLMERAFALRAGLGFVGRNGMVISKEFGSFFNIGLMITDLSLPVTRHTDWQLKCPPECKSCINACPSAAISQDNPAGYAVNAYSCLSYLTQKKDALTEEEITLMGTQLYGCDICQRVCPFNTALFANFFSETLEFSPDDIISMDECEFQTKFGHTAMMWRGLSVLRRNAEIMRDNKFYKDRFVSH